jgi:hypothetical protein
MQSASHTPGPWVVGWNGGKTGPTCPSVSGPTVAGRNLPFALVGIGLETIAICPQQREQSDGGEANARLIAAAPDLLDACRAAEEWLNSWASAEPYIATIRAAIAKATGEARNHD